MSFLLVKVGEKGPDEKIAKTVEHRLLQDLIYSKSYSREVRPAVHNSDVLRVQFSMSLVQIVDVVSFKKYKKVNIISGDGVFLHDLIPLRQWEGASGHEKDSRRSILITVM